MCKLKNITVDITKIHFDKKDRMWVFLSDKREIIIPLSMLPTIQKTLRFRQEKTSHTFWASNKF